MIRGGQRNHKTEWVHWFMGSWVHGLMGVRVHGLMSSWVHGFMSSRVHGFTGSWVHGCTGSRFYGFMGSRAHGFMGPCVICIHTHRYTCIPSTGRGPRKHSISPHEYFRKSSRELKTPSSVCAVHHHRGIISTCSVAPLQPIVSQLIAKDAHGCRERVLTSGTPVLDQSTAELPHVIPQSVVIIFHYIKTSFQYVSQRLSPELGHAPTLWANREIVTKGLIVCLSKSHVQ